MRLTPLARPALAALAALFALRAPVWAAAPALHAAPAQTSTAMNTSRFDGVVEAVHQTVIASQVSGAVVQVNVQVGERVSQGQVLLRLDARAADQTAAAIEAQVQSARASLDVASKDFERQKQLFLKNYISQAALERAESEFKSTQAQATAQLAQAGAAHTQSAFFVVRAPFAGVIAELPVSLGDMALPGKPLLTLYDPAVLRVTAPVPQTVSALMGAHPSVRIELPGLPLAQQWLTPSRTQILPTLDAATHTVLWRADLPAGTPGIAPGMFARIRLSIPPAASGTTSIQVPRTAIVRRAEMTGLYVLDAKNQPVLRQVRLGRTEGEQVEVLSGLTPGERVVADPQAAARTH